MTNPDKVRNEVMKHADSEHKRMHISLVVKYARHLAKSENEDEGIAELGALLHDIGRFVHGGDKHEITGIPEAERILKKLDYPDDVVEEVKDCIRNHRASGEFKKSSKIAMIIRDADALSHFDSVPELLKTSLKKHDNDLRKAVEWLDAKLERDWNNKMHFKESKRLAERKYKAAKLILGAQLEAMEIADGKM